MLERLHVDGERFLKALVEESAWFWFLLASAVMSLRFVTEPCNWTSLSRLSRAERGRRASRWAETSDTQPIVDRHESIASLRAEKLAALRALWAGAQGYARLTPSARLLADARGLIDEGGAGDAFLLRFLRASKFSQLRAQNMIDNFCTVRSVEGKGR